MTDQFNAGFRPYYAQCPACDEVYYRDQPWKRVCLTCYLDKKGRAAPSAKPYPVMTSPIPADMLKRLIFLVHPDKHQGSEAANIATRYLLAIKGACHE